MHLLVWIAGFLLFNAANGKYDACLHNHTNGKHCTSNARSILASLLIQPTTAENQACHTLCIQSGYTAGGNCSVSKDCFRFCSCYHSTNITISSE